MREKKSKPAGRRFAVGEEENTPVTAAEESSADEAPDVEPEESPQEKPKVKAKQPSKGKKPPPKKGKRKKKKWPIVVAIIVLVLALAGAIGYVTYRYQQARAREERINQLAVQANDIVLEINNALASKAPSTWVYDRDENLVMTLRLAQGIQTIDTTPPEIRAAVMMACNNDPVMQVLQEYIVSHSMLSSEELIEAYKMRLESAFSQDDIIKYLAISSVYSGEFLGITDAANNYFGLTIAQCNTQQFQFLAYCYRNEHVDIEKYLSDNNLTEGRLGLIIHRSDYSAMRAKVLEELQQIPGLDVSTTSYMVKLSTSTQQQSILQSSIDNDMRQLIDLNTDGTYTLDCSIVVADRNSGYIRAWIPGRTSSSSSTTSFQMNLKTFLANLTAFSNELRDPNTMNFALRMVNKSNGDKELKSLRELFEIQSLAGGNSETKGSIEALQSIFSMSETFKGTSLIYQVTDTAGTTLYRAPGNTMLYLNNRNLCHYFAGDAQDATAYGFDFELSTGVISMYSTADYVLVALGGSGAMGGTVTSTQIGILKNAINNLKNSVATFYPTPTKNAWDVTGLESAITSCYQQNQGYVESEFNKMLEVLRAIEITSRESRKEFEAQYEAMSQFVKTYEEFVGTTYSDSLRAALQEVRASRTDALLQYAT